MKKVVQSGPTLQISEVAFVMAENSPSGDAALLRAAADWLEKNVEYTLILVSFNGYFGGSERAELKIYVED